MSQEENIDILPDGELTEEAYAALGANLDIGKGNEPEGYGETEDTAEAGTETKGQQISESNEETSPEVSEPAPEPERPRASEILALAQREKQLRQREKEAEAKAQELRDQIRGEVVEELRRQASRDPAKFYGELGLENKRGEIAQDLWYEQLPEDERPPEYEQRRYVRNLEAQVQEMRQLIEERDPQKYMQQVQAQAEERAYRGELMGAAKTKGVIEAIFGDSAEEALWQKAKQMYQGNGQERIPTADEVAEQLESELAETYSAMGTHFGSTQSKATSSSKPSETLSTSDTPKTRRRPLTDADILREAEELIAPYMK